MYLDSGHQKDFDPFKSALETGFYINRSVKTNDAKLPDDRLDKLLNLQDINIEQDRQISWLPQSNFTSRELFSLRQSFYPIVIDYLDLDRVGLYYHNYIDFYQMKTNYCLVVESNGQIIEFDQEQKDYLEMEIKKLRKKLWFVPDHVLVLPLFNKFKKIVWYKNNGLIVDYKWIESMINFLSIDMNRKPFLEKEGLYLEINEVDYYRKLSETIIEIDNEFGRMWSEGYRNDLPTDVIEKWNQTIIDQESKITKSNWENYRLTELYDGLNNFLQSRLETNLVKIRFPHNNLYRHFLAEKKERLIFSDRSVQLELADYEQAMEFLETIYRAEIETEKSSLKSVVFELQSVELLIVYAEILDKLDMNYVTYETTDPRNKYCLSTLISPEKSDFSFRNEIVDKVELELTELDKELQQISPDLDLFTAISRGILLP